MVSVAEKIFDATLDATFACYVGYLLGYAGGHIYAKLGDLPVRQTATAYAISFAAGAAIVNFVESFTADVKYGKFVSSGVRVLVFASTTYELRRSELMGDKLFAALIFLNAIAIWNSFGAKS